MRFKNVKHFEFGGLEEDFKLIGISRLRRIDSLALTCGNLSRVNDIVELIEMMPNLKRLRIGSRIHFRDEFLCLSNLELKQQRLMDKWVKDRKTKFDFKLGEQTDWPMH